MPGGRPSDYNAEKAAELCQLIMEGLSMREIQQREGMPNKSTLCVWLAKHPEFQEQYARAKQVQIEFAMDEAFEIADDGRNDWVDRQVAPGVVRKVVDREAIERSKLRVDIRKWAASKLIPKKYGDRLTQEHTGPDGKALEIRWMTGADKKDK